MASRYETSPEPGRCGEETPAEIVRRAACAPHDNAGPLSVEHGFLPARPPRTRLPASHRPWDDVAAELPALHARLALRDRIETLPTPVRGHPPRRRADQGGDRARHPGSRPPPRRTPPRRDDPAVPPAAVARGLRPARPGGAAPLLRRPRGDELASRGGRGHRPGPGGEHPPSDPDRGGARGGGLLPGPARDARPGHPVGGRLAPRQRRDRRGRRARARGLPGGDGGDRARRHRARPAEDQPLGRDRASTSIRSSGPRRSHRSRCPSPPAASDRVAPPHPCSTFSTRSSGAPTTRPRWVRRPSGSAGPSRRIGGSSSRPCSGRRRPRVHLRRAASGADPGLAALRAGYAGDGGLSSGITSR